MRHGIQALAVLLFFLATLTLFAGRPRATSTWGERVAELELRVAELLVESNAQPVLLDANDVEVGTVVMLNGDSIAASVLMDLDGVPLFTLYADRNHFWTNTGGLYFATSDCSGQAYLSASIGNGTDPQLTHVAYVSWSTGEVWVQTGEPDLVMFRSSLGVDCTARSPQEERLAAASLVPEATFTPPYRIVTRGDLLTE